MRVLETKARESDKLLGYTLKNAEHLHFMHRNVGHQKKEK